jgi:hypothetical protein
VHGIFFFLQIGQSVLFVYILFGFVQPVTYLYKKDFSTIYFGASYFYTLTCTANRHHYTLILFIDTLTVKELCRWSCKLYSTYVYLQYLHIFYSTYIYLQYLHILYSTYIYSRISITPLMRMYVIYSST